MELQKFFPYRVARLAEIVSLATAQVYSSRFKLTRDEWRVIAALAGGEAVKTAFILESSTLDKMRVSRAVARLERDGLVGRSPDPGDKRGHLVRLLPAGQELYERLVPMVLEREAFLLSGLDEEEWRVLDRAIEKIAARAGELVRKG
ncbi:MAG: MarR family transcriptional regulator [Paucimonas sp.]|nr:MarR family transcriptional regulator [Paucimonas sp.]